MASSTAVLSSPPPRPSCPDMDDGDVEMEYEEIEEEAEVAEQIEEEVKAEGAEEGDDDGFGEDLTPVRQENEGIASCVKYTWHVLVKHEMKRKMQHYFQNRDPKSNG